MITSIFINALGQAIFESCGQALLIYVILQLVMQLFPVINSKYRYDMNYLGLTIITCWFLANLIKIYLHNQEQAKYSVLLYGSHISNGIKTVPTLLQQAEAFISNYAKYITGLYMIGLILQAFKLVGGFVHIHHIRKQKNLSEDSFWTTKADALCEKLKIVKKVALHFSAQVDIPLTIGYLKPIIIFPVALVNNLDTDQVEAILMHELAHIKRHDYLLNIIQCIMETLLCFNPFVWLISKTIRLEREYCCDDMVMDEEYNNFTYSKALYIIAQQNNQSYALAMASTGKNKYPLLNRIKRITTMKTEETLPKFNLLVIVAVAAIGSLLAWGIPQYSMAKATHAKNKKITIHLDKAVVSPVLAKKETTISIAVEKKKVIHIYADTSTNYNVKDSINHPKKTFKIVMEDDKGNKKEYNSVQELPDSERNDFLKENPEYGPMVFDFKDSLKFAKFKDFKMSPEMQKQMLVMKIDAEKMGKEFKNNPKFNAQVLSMKIQAEKMSKQFNSPEWKKQMEDMQVQAKKMSEDFTNNPEWQKQVDEMKMQSEKMAKEFKDNPEFKKQAEEMSIQAKKMSDDFTNNPQWKKQVKDIKIQAEKLSRETNSPEMRKQIKEIQIQAKKMADDFQNNPEWRKQMEGMQDNIKKDVDEKIKSTQDSLKTGN